MRGKWGGSRSWLAVRKKHKIRLIRMSVHRQAEDPLYKSVKNRIISSLQAGEWKPGEMLPSEPKLAAAYDVGVSTVRAAVGALASAGIVVRRQGKGTFVAAH